MISKKTFIATLVSLFVLVGAFVPFAIHAAPERGSGIIAQRMADVLGIDQSDLAKYLQQGVKPLELAHVALLAKASGRPLADVMQMKTLANTWKDVRESLGVTRDQMRSLRQDIVATQGEKVLAIPKQSTLDLLHQGYRPRDIMMSNIIARETQKSVADVLAMKQINNRWPDVAQQLGVDKKTLKNDLRDTVRKIHQAFPELRARDQHWGARLAHPGFLG